MQLLSDLLIMHDHLIVFSTCFIIGFIKWQINQKLLFRILFLKRTILFVVAAVAAIYCNNTLTKYSDDGNLHDRLRFSLDLLKMHTEIAETKPSTVTTATGKIIGRIVLLSLLTLGILPFPLSV